MPIGDKIIRLENGKTLIMGILNMTPDSFSSDGKIMGTSSTPLTSGEIVEIVDKMIKNGADIIDIGGQSTRPGAEEVSEDEEIRRVAPVIAAIREAGLKHPLKYEYLAKIPLSVDTYRAGVAKAALDAGADMINDVTGGFGLVDFDEDLYLTGAAVATNLPESSQMVDLWIERQCPVW